MTFRIAMVGQRGLPATYGGIERYVEEIGTRLVQRGHRVDVFCRPNYTPRDMTSYRGVRLINAPTIPQKQLEAFVHSAASTFSALGRGYDVVHFQALGPGLFTVVTRLLSKAAVVQTIHGLDDRRDKWGGGTQRVLRLGGWLSARVPNEVVVVSHELADHYLAVHGRQTTYIPNGVPKPTPRAPAIITEK
jgi:glycosyltransferase involved in cell wall biosynthesis